MDSTDGNGLRDLVRFAVMALVVTAIVKELRTSGDQREGHGKVGPVPYDFRRPTFDRLKARLWSPNRALVQPQVFGVGWTLNLGRLLQVLRASRS